MADFPPFLKPKTRNTLRGLIRRGFATVIDLDEPEVFITLYRTDELTGLSVAQPEVKVSIRTPAPLISTIPSGDMAAEYAMSYGRMRRFAPWDVRVGDTFTLPTGQRAVVTSVPPLRYGIVAASFILDEGAA